MVDELLARYSYSIASLLLVPSSKGRFEVTVDDQLVFSKVALDRHASVGEIGMLFEQHFGVQPMPLPPEHD